MLQSGQMKCLSATAIACYCALGILCTMTAIDTVRGEVDGGGGGGGVGRGRSAGVTCEELGFTGLALCSDCDSLAEYIKDQELESDCRSCCAQEAEDSISKSTYAGAILEICMRKLGYYPNVQSVVEGKLSQFPTVDVHYRYGSPPTLIMKDKKGNHKETIRIDNWKSEEIEQFLKEKVKP